MWTKKNNTIISFMDSLWTVHCMSYGIVVCSLIQAQLGSISIQEFGLTQDTAKIFRNGMRISKCMLGKSRIRNTDCSLTIFLFKFDCISFPLRPVRVSESAIQDWFFCSAQLPNPGKVLQSQALGKLALCFQTAGKNRWIHCCVQMDI